MLVISGPASAYIGNPRSNQPAADLKTLALFHGLVSEDSCVDAFDEPLSEIGITGGRLRIVVETKTKVPTLRITTTYHLPRPLTDAEVQLLVEASRAQWSDGIGSGSFKNSHSHILSTALAMAILNAEPSRTDLGEHFVDAFPMFAADDETRVEYREADEEEKTDLHYLKEAAEFGDPNAQFMLAQRYEDGEDGVDKNARIAFELYQRSALAGNVAALTWLGFCHQKGVGTAVDPKQAYACFTMAASAGYPLAMHCLGECLIEGRGVGKNPQQGVRWYERGAALGDMGCIAQFADCLEYGIGVPIDLSRALELYQRCLDGGFDAVEEAFQRVKKQLAK